MNAPLLDPSEFEKGLEHQTLISERWRTRILSWALAVIFVVILTYQIALSSMGGTLPGLWGVVGIVAIAAIFEIVTGRVVSAYIRTGKERPRWAPYAGAVIQMSLPTAAIVILRHADTPFSALNSAAPYGYFLYIILAALRLDFASCVFAGAVAAAQYSILMVLYWKDMTGYWHGSEALMRLNFLLRSLFLLINGIGAGLVSLRIKRTLIDTVRETQERERITELFGQHVSPAVVNQLLNQPVGQASELRNVCILVLDIRNFTTFSEDRRAEEVVTYLNTLWSFAVRTVNDHNGIVNKFLGDGFLAVFGAPVSEGNDCANALAAAQHIVEEIERLAHEKQLPPTKVGIALHAGEAIAGNIGSSERKEYTVIGDVVNVAFRIEALNKELGSTILISEPVRAGAGVDGLEAIAPMPIRGRREPIQLFKVA